MEFRWKEILTPWEATHCSPIPAASWNVIYWAQEVSWKRDKGKIRRAPPPLEEGYHTSAPYFQADLLCCHHCCCLSDLGTTRQTVNMFFKSETRSMSSWAVAPHLLPPPQSHHSSFYSCLPSPANLQLELSLLLLENKVVCCLLCKGAKHKTKKFTNCSVLSNGLLSLHLQGK